MKLVFDAAVVESPIACAYCGEVVMAGELVMVCDHEDCGHEAIYCGECAGWRSLLSDSTGETTGLTSWWLAQRSALN